MIPALLFPFSLAAITAAPATPSPGATPEPPPIHDITPPLDVFPYPPWMIVTAGLVVLAVLGLVIWAMVRVLRHRVPPVPPSPTQIALRELARLRDRVTDTEPYAFSFAVSDVLRTFISQEKGHVPATQQTSPEFLSAISGSPLFSEGDRVLLSRFLEKCDMIKFARIDATSEDNAELVASALAFVQGEAA